MKEMQSPLAYPIFALQLALTAAICGCAHVDKIRDQCKEVPECRPVNFLGYYSTNWMPIEYYGTVEIPSCYPSASCSRCTSAALEGKATDDLNAESANESLVVTNRTSVSDRDDEIVITRPLEQSVVPHRTDETVIPSYATNAFPGDYRDPISNYNDDRLELFPEHGRDELKSPLVEVSALRIQEATRF